MKPMKDVLKNDNRHVFCDFGIKKFNQGKRSQDFVDEMNILEAAARTQQDNKKPSKPSGVYVTPTASSLILNWTASTDNVAVAGYKVTINGGLPITVTSGLSYSFTGLSANTSYTLTVASYDTSGNNSVGASIIGTTSVDPNVTTTTTSTSTTSTTTSAGTTTTTSTSTTSTTTISGGDTIAPTVPIITSVVAGQTEITLTWGASSDNAGVSGYITEMVGIGIFGTSSTTYTFTGLTAGTTYSIRLYAYDAVGNRSDNTWVTATTLGGTTPPTPPPTSSSSVIFCDFNGHTVSGTYWNTNGNIVAAPSGLTLSEQDAVVAAMQADYAPYDITVTGDEAVYNAANVSRRMRVIFTTSWEWYGQVGGVAYIGSFTWGTNTPCFVFTSLLGYNTRYIYTAGSHEAGHTLGLRHQVLCSGSTIVNEYNPGDAVNGAPTMGNSYYNTPKWWIGPNSLGCSNIQNDNTILTQVLGPHP